VLNAGDDNIAGLVADFGKERVGDELVRLRAKALLARRPLLSVIADDHEDWQRLRAYLSQYKAELQAGSWDELPVGRVAEIIAHTLCDPPRRELRRLIMDLENNGLSLGEWREWWTFGRQEQDRVQRNRDGAVHILTVHASKGLEWPVVIGIGVDDCNYPKPNSDPEDLEEDRRVLYVMVTRAQERMYLLWNSDRCASPFLPSELRRR
jgi:superfamily I DNA/RNA helicase